MILKSLEAENFQKYERIQIGNLPERGIVGVVGDNESGKSTLGEAIAFAFFGRTLRLDEAHVTDIINWSKETCQVRVTFQLPDGAIWRISREIDRDGSYSAQLEDAGSGEVVAKGVGKVNRKLAELFAVPFEEFRYSFYLGQKELSILHDSSPDTRRRLLDKMIGVNNIDEASDRVTTELDSLKARRKAFDEEAAVHREVARQIAIDPKERDRALASIRETEREKSSVDAELSRAAVELEEVTRNGHALGVARALGLRAILRGYGVAFTRLASWLRQAAGQLHSRLASLDRDAAAATVKLEEYRIFEAKRDELASVVKVRRHELETQLRNNMEADYRLEDAAFITPNSKAEQLSFTQKKLSEAQADLTRLQDWARRRITIGAILWLAGFALLFGLREQNFIFFVVFGILYMTWGLVTRANAADADEKRSRLNMNADRLAEDVGKFESALAACARFDTSSARSMADNVGALGSELIRDLHRTLTTRFADFLAQTESHADELIGKIHSLRDEAAAVRREQAEVELLTADLEEEIERLSRGGHARVVRSAGASADAYRSGEAREWRARVRAMIDRCRKAQFHLEEAPAGALDRDFAEFGPALASQPQTIRGSLNVQALSDLDAGSSNLETSLLERTLEDEGEKLQGLVAASDELRTRAESLGRRQQDLKMGTARSALKLEELNRELARIEPGIARGVELEKQLAAIAGKLGDLDHSLQVHQTLLAMFEELRDRMRGRFGPQLAEYIAHVLPILTNNRYQDVKVTPELNVEVYSADKGDYISLSSLSGGTVDQLFLTLRLAFSKALIHTHLAPDYKQYLFFDEPLTSFDEKRSGSFLDLLRKFHCNFDQVFVVTHALGVEGHFDRLIRTSLDTRELVSN